MSTQINPLALAARPIPYGLTPKEGPKCVPISLNFQSTGTYFLDYSQQERAGYLSMIQTMWIDATQLAAGETLTVTIHETGQIIEVPEGSQGYFPVLASNPFKVTFSSGHTIIIASTAFVYLINVKIDPLVTGGSTGGGAAIIAPPYVLIGASLYYGPFVLVSKPPAIGTMTWFNQGGALATSSNGCILLAAPTNSGDSIRGLTVTYPLSLPFTFTLGMQCNAASINYSAFGIVVTDGTQFITFGPQYDDNSEFFTGWGCWLREWSNATTPSGGPIGAVSFSNAGVPIYLTLTDDGTHMTFWMSYDANDLKRIQVAQIGSTSFLNATGIGFFIDVNNTTYPASMEVFDWMGI